MTPRLINKADLTEFITRLRENYRVYGPVRQGETSSFQRLTEQDKLDLDLANTLLSPKSLMLLQSERMFEFTLDASREQAGILRECGIDDSSRVILGIRPCDAMAFRLLDLNFDTPTFRDPWWCHRRNSTSLVGVGCSNPCHTCFCTSVGGGPYSTDGLDLLLTEMDDRFLVEVCTDKGLELLSAAGQLVEPSEEALTAARERQRLATRSLQPKVATERMRDHDVTDLFEADFWDEVQFACINCGVCTFVCPTCWCFDIQDEVHQGRGIRMRNWDACMFPLFTIHGSGHNPRDRKLQRFRQRFMHKLKYFPDKYHSGLACVGCGRCVQHCPVNIDIREVMRQMNDFQG